MSSRKILQSTVSLAVVLSCAMAFGQADIAVVGDFSSDQNMTTVLLGGGYTVDTFLNDYSAGNNAFLQSASVFDYHIIFWDAVGTGSGGVHNSVTFTNLEAYVAAGGAVFVTGYDTLASPTDSNLQTFVGAISAADGGTVSGAAVGTNSLTTGVVNIVGVVPSGAIGDQDTVTALGSAVGVVPSSAGGGWVWTLRSAPSSEVAYVSAGANSGGSDPAFLDTSPGGAGAYNAALRNFAFAHIPEPTTMSLLGLVSLIGLPVLRRRR